MAVIRGFVVDPSMIARDSLSIIFAIMLKLQKCHQGPNAIMLKLKNVAKALMTLASHIPSKTVLVLYIRKCRQGPYGLSISSLE